MNVVQCLSPHCSVPILKQFVKHRTGINSCISLVMYDNEYFLRYMYCLLGCLISHCEYNLTTALSNPEMRLLIQTLYINATWQLWQVFAPPYLHQYYGPLSYWSSTCARQNSSLRHASFYNPTGIPKS